MKAGGRRHSGADSVSQPLPPPERSRSGTGDAPGAAPLVRASPTGLESLSGALRIGAALVLVAWGFVELLRLVSLAPSPSRFALVAHSVLGSLSIWAGIEVWWRRSRARLPILLLGFGLAGLLLVEALALGTRPWLLALLSAAAVVTGTLFFAAWAVQAAQPGR